MAKLVWNDVGKRFFETGIDRGVLYVDDTGTAWNGLVSVDESPSGGEARPFYIDGEKYLNVSAKEEFEATISAFYSPVEFDECDGYGALADGVITGQQRRKPFGLSYRTRLGNDLKGTDYGYKIHLIYNALVAPTTRNYASIGDSIEAQTLAWPITTKPIPMPGMLPSATLVIDTTQLTAAAIEELEKALYGTDSTVATLPTPEEILTIISTADLFTVVDLGGGKFKISGRNENVFLASPGVYTITHDTAVVLVPGGAEISSV